MDTQIILVLVIIGVAWALFPVLRKLGEGLLDILLMPLELFADIISALLSNPALALLFVALVAWLAFALGRGVQ